MSYASGHGGRKLPSRSRTLAPRLRGHLHWVAAQCAAVFTMVTMGEDVEQVILGQDGIIHGAKPGTVVIESSTIAPAITRRIAQVLAEKGVEMLDAPVSGGEKGAIDGTLSIMVGGKADVFERMQPVLGCLGRSRLQRVESALVVCIPLPRRGSDRALCPRRTTPAR
jgi:6-phosphogluconate dehydrogenase (decarboxylating)